MSDPAKAARFYAAAAAAHPGTTFIWVPGVQGRSGYVLPVRAGPDEPGLPEASYRLGLMYIEGRGVRRSSERGRRLIEQAAKAGYAPARAMEPQLAR